MDLPKYESDNIIYKSDSFPEIGLLWINKVPKEQIYAYEDSYFDPNTTKIIIYITFILILLSLLVFSL